MTAGRPGTGGVVWKPEVKNADWKPEMTETSELARAAPAATETSTWKWLAERTNTRRTVMSLEPRPMIGAVADGENPTVVISTRASAPAGKDAGETELIWGCGESGL